MTMRSAQDFRYLVGMTIEEARTLHSNIRIASENGSIIPLEGEVDNSRLNVEIVNDRITVVKNFE